MVDCEPEPEVIVIDLRETWTVGPVIMVLDWVIGYVERTADGSGVVAGFEGLYVRTLKAPLPMAGRGLVVLAVFAGLAATVSRSIAILGVAVLCGLSGLVALQDDRSWAELKQTRAVELLIATFKPSAPPGERELQGGESTDEHHRPAKYRGARRKRT